MSKLSKNRAKIAQILADIDRLPEDRYYEGKEEGRVEGRAEGEAIGYENALSKRTELVVEENGTYEPQGDSTGFKSVKVAVPERVPILQEKTATENGEVVADSGYDGLSKVTVNVAQTGGGSTGGDIDAFIDGSIAEVSSGATKVIDYALRNRSLLKTANFPNAISIGEYAFEQCSGLLEANFQIAKSVGNYAFNYCSALQSINAPNVTHLGMNSFSKCAKLTSADFPKVETMYSYTFEGCSSLKTANFPSASSIPSYAFRSCYNLETVNFSSATSVGNYVFNSCNKLGVVDLPKATSIGSNTFQNCYVLKEVILRSETVCTLSNTNAFSNCYHIIGTVNASNPTGAKDGYFYVPRALVDSYKAATNWSTYSTQFRALEDYTVDGTITGELDETKI